MTHDQQTPRPATRSADEIEQNLAATRERLAGALDALQNKVRPENLMKDGLAKVKGIYVKPDGGVRIERVAATAAAVVGVVVLKQGLRSWSRKRAAANPEVVYVPVLKSALGA